MPMNLPQKTGGKYGPKSGLIAGCDYRACVRCEFRVFVPSFSDWTTCTPCRKGWTHG